MTIVEKINDGIKDAMKSRDQIRLDTLRMLKSKILAVDARGNLPEGEVIKLFKTYSGNLYEALEQAQAAKRTADQHDRRQHEQYRLQLERSRRPPSGDDRGDWRQHIHSAGAFQQLLQYQKQ